MLNVDLNKAQDQFSLVFTHCFQLPCVGIFGPSGSGKSTLLHLISGLLIPDRGKITLNQRILFDDKKNIPTSQRRIGYVRQEPLLFPHLSIQNNLYFAQKYCTQPPLFTLDELVQQLELASLLSRKPHTLSGGEKQRAALARALLAAPQYLLLDEPMASLDEENCEKMIAFLLHCKQTIPLIYVSHHPQRMNTLADEVLFLQHGRCVNNLPKVPR